MREYNSIEELKADKELQTMSRYAHVKARINGKEVIVCRTNQQYEDIIWGGVYDVMEKLNEKYGLTVDTCNYASEIRDIILGKLSDEYDVHFVDIFDEY